MSKEREIETTDYFVEKTEQGITPTLENLEPTATVEDISSIDEVGFVTGASATISETDVFNQLDALGESRLKQILGLCGHDQWNYPARMLAVMSRETNCLNIDGDPMTPAGHGKGGWQIDNRSHAAQLEAVVGVRSGTWGPVIPGARAINLGMVPTLHDGLTLALEIMKGNWNEAVRASVIKSKQPWVMMSAYNAGFGGAMEGYYEGNSDNHTTGGNYASDVFGRETFCHAYLHAHKMVK